MISPLKIGIKILALLIIPLAVYLLSYNILISLFSFIQKVVLLFNGVDFETLRHTAIFFSGGFVAYIFFVFVIRPLFHIISWIQLLSQGNFQESTMRSQSKKNFLNQCAQFFYKELFMQLNILAEKLKQKETDQIALEKNRREWLSGITHDLKTPLAYIQGYASMISAEKYEWTDRELNEFGKKIEEKSRHIKDLIDDLNLSFQSKDGKISVCKKNTEMVEYMRNVILDIANLPCFSAYTFSFDSNTKTAFLKIDTTLMQRVLQNILMNAVVHNPPETEIVVSLIKKKEAFIIQITDNGDGMLEETKRNLFERYYRGTSTEHPTEGSGLGMAIAKKFVELHDGSIYVESVLKQGTTICIKLPN